MTNRLKIVTRLSGGLGNQLHQYAYAFLLAKKTGGEVYVDKSFYELDHKRLNITKRICELDNFSIGIKEYKFFLSHQKTLNFFLRISFLRNLLKTVFKIRIITSRSPQNELHQGEKIFYVVDVFGTVADYLQVYRELQLLFLPNREKLLFFKVLEKTIVKHNAVAVHVRRTDYLNPESVHEVLPIDYYQRAMEFVRGKIDTPTFYVFGDDEAWIRDNFNLSDPNIVFTNFKGDDPHLFDFFAISYCEHCIISNSTFAWWAAFLNANINKAIIAPAVWLKGSPLNTNDAYLNDWHVI